MKKLLPCICMVGLALAACVPSRAADNRWNGTWKLNVLRSNRASDNLLISRFYSEAGYDPKTGSYGATPRATMAYISEGLDFEFSCNGRAYPVKPDRNVTCVQAPDGSWTFTVTSNGKPISKCRHLLSKDGETLTVSCVKTNANGSQTNSEDTYMSANGQGGGMVGTWKKRPSATNPETVNFTVQGDSIRIASSVPKTVVEAKLNGDPAPITGPGVPAGTTESVKFDSPTRLHTTVMNNGKKVREAILDMSPDGHTIDESRWIPRNDTLYWEKQ
jgi:hypothetical protein